MTSNKEVMCFQCELDLPRTNHFAIRDNIFYENFENVTTFESASALFYFAHMTKVQRLIHQIKYHNRPELAISLGEILGNEIKKCAHLQNIAAIVPVPLHPKRLKARGYNQSERIAQGIANVLDVPIETQIIKKIVESSSQTHRSRAERKTSLLDTFESQLIKKFENTALLLVDDVSTSGATFEALGDCILRNNPTVKLHCVALAYTNN